ncbi:uncharacterized protein F4812DRAFT_363617 [Daldinia caldariorum]|uniref:uncharacterized protein n=1 Tax=Daldinia caldariorum TaxID=326644 RepID=UPI00200752AE|nr:uncharacterized protein F4812DRAFT_363617 [Daldinia caldariorum]KAI1468357.1 hypothetical protein F4812DRAFT_363617 [Daldinia caldariorum]
MLSHMSLHKTLMVAEARDDSTVWVCFSYLILNFAKSGLCWFPYPEYKTHVSLPCKIGIFYFISLVLTSVRQMRNYIISSQVSFFPLKICECRPSGLVRGFLPSDGSKKSHARYNTVSKRQVPPLQAQNSKHERKVLSV